MERIAAHDDERECDARGCRQRGDRRAKNSMTGSYDLCDRRYPILWLLHEFTIIIQTLFYRIAAIMVLSTSRTSQKGLIVIGIVALFSIPRLFVTINVLRSILFFVQSPETFNTDIATMLIEDPLPALLRDAGLENSTLASKLPSWKDLSAIYGSDESVILVGADTCESFRDAVPQYERYLAVAGKYNSGTNLLAKYFQENCQIMGAKGTFLGMLWQVSWGKHTFPQHKFKTTKKGYEIYNKTATMPIVIVRDPYQWMQSMCSHSYDVRWPHGAGHCPNLISRDSKNETIPAKIRYLDSDLKLDFPSLVHIWNEFYSEYVAVDYPRIMVRYEDMVFRPEKMIREACACVGGEMKSENFTYSASENIKYGEKGHGEQEKAGLLEYIIKNGNASKRVQGLSEKELEYSNTTLSDNLMKAFRYILPAIETMTA